MNLIEQLGGYEKAKEKRGDISHTLDNSELLGGGDAREGLYERLESIDKALLEYRRQHNIFEAGDVAVSVDGEPYLHKVELGTSKAHCIKIFSHDMAHSYWVHDANYRHAADEEIKAGKRLEVNQ